MIRRFIAYVLNVNEGGHERGLLTCSKYGHHRHLPLGLIKWELTD